MNISCIQDVKLTNDKVLIMSEINRNIFNCITSFGIRKEKFIERTAPKTVVQQIRLVHERWCSL